MLYVFLLDVYRWKNCVWSWGEGVCVMMVLGWVCRMWVCLMLICVGCDCMELLSFMVWVCWVEAFGVRVCVKSCKMVGACQKSKVILKVMW